MKKHIRLLTASLAIMGVIGCSVHAVSESQSSSDASLMRNNVSYADVIKVDAGEPFMTLSYGDDPLQFGKLWLANTPHHSGASPLVIFIHGGCWLNAYDIKHSYAFTSALAQQGYTVWSLEYRRTGDEGGGWPGSFNDVLQGINFIKKQSAYPIMHNNIVLTGHSAGGHLALLAGGQLPADSLQGVIGLAAITDIEEYASGENSCQQATTEFMGGDTAEKPDAYALANPAKQPLHPNLVLLQGELDSIVPLDQHLGKNVETKVQAGAGHFDWIDPKSAAFKTLKDHLAEMTSS